MNIPTHGEMAAFNDQPYVVFPNLWEEPEPPRAIATNRSSRPDPPQPEDWLDWKPTKQVWLILAGQCCCLFVVALDATIFSATLPTVSEALHADAVGSYWIITAYLLPSAVVQPIMAALADVFGRRSSFFLSVLIFTAGTIICGTSSRILQMLIGRIVQGIGCGGIFSVNNIIMSDLFPLRQRSKYQGVVQLVGSFGTTFAPALGAGLVSGASWRWVCLISALIWP